MLGFSAVYVDICGRSQGPGEIWSQRARNPRDNSSMFNQVYITPVHTQRQEGIV